MILADPGLPLSSPSRVLWEALVKTLKVTCMIMLILLGGNMFAGVFVGGWRRWRSRRISSSPQADAQRPGS